MSTIGEISAVAGPLDHDDASRSPPAYAWFALGMLALVNALNYMDRWVMSVLIQPIKQDLHLTDTQLGLLTGLAFSLAYAVAAIPIARWADRGVRRDVLVGAITLWSLMTGLAGFATNFWQLLLARIGVGVGEAGCIPTGHSLISDYFPKDFRAFALALFSAGSMAGKVLGIGGAGLLVGLIGWKHTLMALALPGFAVAVLVRLSVREPRRGRYDRALADTGAPPLRTAARSLVATPSYVLICLGLAFGNLVIFGLQNWSPSFYMRVYGLTATQVGAAVATVVGVGSAVGLVGGGYATQWLMRRDPRWAPAITSVVQIVGGTLSVATFTVENPTLSLLLFAASSIVGSLPSGAIMATLLNVADPRSRALASAVAVALVSIIGLGLGPLIVGSLSDLFANSLGENEGLRAALVTVALLQIIPAVLFMLAARHLPADLRSLDARLVSSNA